VYTAADADAAQSRGRDGRREGGRESERECTP
jgi:hypothetical protein